MNLTQLNPPATSQSTRRKTLDSRRLLGRYDTPRPLSQAVADWAIRTAEDKALEPSSGSGVFVLSLAHRLKILGQDVPNRQLWACDIDPRATEQTKEVTGLNSSHLWTADFLSLVDETGIKGHKFDCVVGNPPYISLHRMPIEQRTRALKAAERLHLGIGGRASLWAYFLAVSTKVLEVGGRIGFILPESILHAEYALSIVRTFARYFQRCALVSLRERCFVTEGAAERVVVLLADGFALKASSTEISLRECITADEAVRVISEMCIGKAQLSPILNGHAVPHLIPNSGTPLPDLSSAPNSHALGDFADVKIGVVTGADAFFLLSEPERKRYRIRHSWLRPLLPRFQECRSLSFSRSDWKRILESDLKCWLLSPTHTADSKALRSYLRRFPIKARETNRTFEKRRHWYAPILGRKAHAFLRYMGAAGPRIAFARFNVTCTNIIHRVYFNSDVSALKRKALVLSLHSSFSQLSAEFEGRAYGSGVLKLEPSESRRLRFLLPSILRNKEVDRCFATVDRHLRCGDIAGATTAVDKWLYSGIPELEKTFPRERLSSILRMTIQRRLGYPLHFTMKADRKNGSIGFGTEIPFFPSRPSSRQNAASK